MSLPKQDLLKGCKYPNEIDVLLGQAEDVIRTWQPSWSDFISAPLREEVLRVMKPLHELRWYSDGGLPNAERQRMFCKRFEDGIAVSPEAAPIMGLRIEGNFLFDKASPTDFRKALTDIGCPTGELGDIWVLNDRGANAICTKAAALAMDGSEGIIRDVTIQCEAVENSELQLPAKRVERRFTSVEASTRVDAIASAGFGLSRAKVVKQINQGYLRLNWLPIRQASQELITGDRIQLEGKGSLEILSLELTKRKRWRVKLLRH